MKKKFCSQLLYVYLPNFGEKVIPDAFLHFQNRTVHGDIYQ